MNSFHLSIGVRSLEESADFFVRILDGVITHEDESGYVNIDLFGTQITLAKSAEPPADMPGFHFGINVDTATFERLAQQAREHAPARIVMQAKTVDAGTPMERSKMFLRCPSGYLVEIKGYPQAGS